MHLEYSYHWTKKRKRRRQDITDYMIEYCITNSIKIRDKNWIDVWNAVARIPTSNRVLKVVYKTKGKTIKILTAYWIKE